MQEENKFLIQNIAMIESDCHLLFTELHNFEFGAIVGKKTHRSSSTNNQFSLPLLGHAAEKPNKMPSLEVHIS